MLAFLRTIVAFLAALLKPYYQNQLASLGYRGSPPLAIWSGLMAFACTPVIIALSNNTHIFIGLVYLGLLFWHGGNILDSWA